ncbi:MAG: TraB/GumN family protein [Bacteroidetes bacterium]|nr:MAG: TraB/GumN family protein [Bacteroidota bacterium]PTM11722.1 MAG: TraB/GumN family protein [Bacteroidota bacterium]
MKWIARLLPLNLLVFFTVTLAAQPAAVASFAPTTAENFLLWKISGQGLQSPSYLFGTIHMIPEEHYLLNEPTQKAFDKSTRIAFEIDTEDMMNPAAMMGLMSKMYMNNDTSLADLLPAEDYQLVADHFDEIGLPMVFMGRIKPMFLTVLAGEGMPNAKPGAGGMGAMMGEGIKSYELELTERAKTQEKPIVGLETAEFQMSLFDSIPYTAQAQMLLEAIKSEQGDSDDATDTTMDKMIELYTTQDIVGMQGLMDDDSASGMGGYEDLLLLQRNRNWIPVMQGLMAKETVFFAVGAGHLAGEEGVIALLRKAGYTVEPEE